MNDEELLEQTTPEEITADQVDDVDHTDDPETTPGEGQSDPAPEEPKYKVKYNGKEMELSVSDLTTYAQKGMNYDHVRNDLDNQRKTSAESQSALDRLTSVLKQFGYSGSAQEIADTIEAQQREVEPDQVRREREALEAQELARQQAESMKIEAENLRREAVFARDLAEIQRLNPNIRTLNDLGETFFKLRGAGISNLEAYELSKPKTPAKPTSTGKEHLITTEGGASTGGLVDIPKSDLAFWRESFPDDTPAKLKERYNRARKRQGE